MKFKIEKITFRKEYAGKGEPFKNRNKIYIWPSGETVMENFNNRRNRPYDFYKKEILPKIVEMLEKKNLLGDADGAIKNAKWSWNRKCGCSMCPCSPGFVSSTYGYVNIHATVSFSE